MKTKLLFSTSIVILLTITALAQIQFASFAKEKNVQAIHADWVKNSLSKIETIKVGMTRGQLLEIFTTEGGLSTGLQRTYVYRECPYIKVDVKFTATGRPERDKEGRVTLQESNKDIIQSISVPYLQWTIAD